MDALAGIKMGTPYRVSYREEHYCDALHNPLAVTGLTLERPVSCYYDAVAYSLSCRMTARKAMAGAGRNCDG